MSKPVKQHFIPKVYLKYFSASEDGQGIYILDLFHPYKKAIQIRNAGDKIFWEKNYYTTDYFEDVYHLENFFNITLESRYNSLIHRIKEERPITDWDTKLQLFEWIFYGKFRSPVFRDYFEDQLIRQAQHDLSDIKRLAKEAHLEIFKSKEYYDRVLSEILSHFLSKRWKLFKTSDVNPFLTSDSPGFGIRLDHFENEHKTAIPTPFWDNAIVDTLFFFPLTKNFALTITAYERGTPLYKNLENTPIVYEMADEAFVTHMNFWTICTGKILISSDWSSLRIVESIRTKLE